MFFISYGWSFLLSMNGPMSLLIEMAGFDDESVELDACHIGKLVFGVGVLLLPCFIPALIPATIIYLLRMLFVSHYDSIEKLQSMTFGTGVEKPSLTILDVVKKTLWQGLCTCCPVLRNVKELKWFAIPFVVVLVPLYLSCYAIVIYIFSCFTPLDALHSYACYSVLYDLVFAPSLIMTKEGLHVMYYLTGMTFYAIFAWGCYGFWCLWSEIDHATEYQWYIGLTLLSIQSIYVLFDIIDMIQDTLCPSKSMVQKMKDSAKAAVKTIATCSCFSPSPTKSWKTSTTDSYGAV